MNIQKTNNHGNSKINFNAKKVDMQGLKTISKIKKWFPPGGFSDFANPRLLIERLSYEKLFFNENSSFNEKLGAIIEEHNNKDEFILSIEETKVADTLDDILKNKDSKKGHKKKIIVPGTQKDFREFNQNEIENIYLGFIENIISTAEEFTTKSVSKWVKRYSNAKNKLIKIDNEI